MSLSGSRPRIAFVTIGQTPRTDLVPEVLAAVGSPVDAFELGVLDGVTADQIESHAPGAADHALVTRLADGSEVVVAKHWIERRLLDVIDSLDAEPCDAVVLLCTGHFSSLRRGRHLLLEAQRIVDASIGAFAFGAASMGIIVPLERQTAEFHPVGVDAQVRFAYASPYAGDRLDAASGELRSTDFTVLHCIGYTEAMRRRVADNTGKPVLLARRLVASAVSQLT